MQLGDIVYLHIADLTSVLAVQQKLIDNRFGKIVKAVPIKGGKPDSQYIQYTIQSLTDKTIVRTINNYLSPYKASTLVELEQSIKSLSGLIMPEQLDNMNYLIKKIKSLSDVNSEG